MRERLSVQRQRSDSAKEGVGQRSKIGMTMTGAPRRNHTVSAGYLSRFAKGGRLTVHHATRGTREDGPRAVGFQKDFWGPARLAREVEEAFNKCENPALRALRKLSERWPLETPERALLAQFLAIHVIRTPAFSVFARRSGVESVRDVAQRHRLAPDEVAAATEWIMGPHMHANALIGQIGRIASIFSSMQWTLVQFDHDFLITCDQPVMLLPLVSTPITPASSVPPNGFPATVEVRFTLDPRQMLLMTWAEIPDSEHPIKGTHSQACSVNCALQAQALEEWVYRPGTTPPFLSPPLLQRRIYPISFELISGYTFKVATQSRRRVEADRLMAKMIEEDAPRDRMRWVRLDHREAA